MVWFTISAVLAWYDYTEKCASIYHAAHPIQHISKKVTKANLGQLVVVMKVSRSTILTVQELNILSKEASHKISEVQSKCGLGNIIETEYKVN